MGKINYEKIIDNILHLYSIGLAQNEFNDDSISYYFDPLLEHVMIFVSKFPQISTSSIQREFLIGYNRSGRIIDQLEYIGIVGEFKDGKRKVVCNDSNLLKGGFLNEILALYKDEITRRVEFYKSKILQEIEEKERKEIEKEKEIIKQKLFEKQRKNKIRQTAIDELRKEGFDI